MTKVLVTKPGVLTVADKRKLRNAGVVAVEAEQPEDVRLISVEGPAMTGDEMLFAAITACQISAYSKQALAEQMLEALQRTRATQEPKQ